MDSITTTSALAFGFVLGLRHAVEADHLAAVSAIVSERKSVLGASLLGGLWGLGHTISLFAAALAVVLFDVRLGERAAHALEACVGVMLVALGANALRKLARGGRMHLHSHRHGGREHAHPHAHDAAELAREHNLPARARDAARAHRAARPRETPPAHEAAHTHHGLRFDARTVLVGMLHGLAGSAALMLLVVSAVESPLLALLYVFVFGVGSAGGMMLMGALVGLPMRLTAERFTRANLLVRGAAGLFSVGLGVLIIYEMGAESGLLGAAH
jgi:ABC-type nickel/cobalt efflux system permease component RcnA